jgi:hypothetical protein
MKKSILAIITTAIILASLLAPIITTVQATVDPTSWYKTVNGVLNTDYYTLYPYETTASLKIGFSKFGEMIDSSTNTGIEFDTVDPFAPAAGSSLTANVPKNLWVQGWLMNITYRHRTLGDRNVWAMALFSDSLNYGNDWIRVDFANDKDTVLGLEDPKDPGSMIYGTAPYSATPTNYGGRKTNGTAVTDPIVVLYDGPREFIGICRTTLYDHPIMQNNDTTGDVPLVQIAITIRFDKVKKDVVLMKDVKSLLPLKEGEQMKIQFSNRGEVDLGNDAAGYASYMHFYTEGTSGTLDTEDEGRYTWYDDNWTRIQTEDPLNTNYQGYSAAGPYPQTGLYSATYDVAQAINPIAKNVWFASFWPSLSDWSIDGWDQWWHSLSVVDPHYIDLRVPSNEPSIPFYIGEWDFVLWDTSDSLGRTQFRGVTTYGVVYSHNADDANMGATHANVIDDEVDYYLDEQFLPWDMSDAVWYKNTARWVKFVAGPKSGSITLPGILQYTDWYEYRDDAEKLITLPDKTLWARGKNYTLTATGVTLINSVPAGKTLKILWSNQSYETIDGNTYGPRRYEWVTIGRYPEAATVDSAGAALITAAIKQKNSTIGLAGEDMNDSMLANMIPSVMSKFGTGETVVDYKDTLGRAGLKDDWCTYWPISSSNMIASGGPLANLLTYYANDFTDAFYGLPTYAGTAYSGKVVPITCWDRAWPTTGGLYRTYASNSSEGYAVISTYLDLNGTVIFEVWGHWGRDTYYASQWLHGDVARAIPPGIVQLQDSPWGLTSIILKINYADPTHPTFSIVECLGTISETLWTHRYTSPFTGLLVTEVKGGIHDP